MATSLERAEFPNKTSNPTWDRRGILEDFTGAYRVDIARSAEAELDKLYRWVVEGAPQQGAAWVKRG